MLVYAVHHVVGVRGPTNTSAPRYQGWPGCPALTDTSYYEIHAKQADQNYRRYERDSEINKRYGAAWRKIRAAYVAPPLRDV